MAIIRLIHWNGPEGRAAKLRLASFGHHVEFDDIDGPGLGKVLRRTLPDAYVIDLSRLPSGGRQVGMWLRTHQRTRHIPLLFVDGDPEKVKRLRELLPDAVYTTWPRLKSALPKALAAPPASPVIPPSSIYTGRSTADKLGVKPAMRLCVVNAPPGFAKTLDESVGRLTYTARPQADCDLFIVFVRSRRELAIPLTTLTRDVTKQTLWIAWPKKASGVKADVDGRLVRESALAAGWVDFKVCAIDATWSGLAFKRRK
jgi:hypothetical protein